MVAAVTVLIAGSVLLLAGGCRCEPVDRTQDDVPTAVSTSPSPTPSAADEPTPTELDDRIYVDQATLPSAEAYEHVGVATTSGELGPQWQRFGFADVPPVIDMESRDVVFFGFGESGSCPVVFGGIDVDGSTLRFIDDQPEQGCTADHNPRTIAVSVAEGVLPDGYLTIDMPADAEDVTISMSGTGEPPPATADAVSASISDVSLVPEPARAPIGTAIDVLIHNRSGPSSWTSTPVILFAADGLGTPEYNDAWCRASLNGPDPAEGFSC